MDEFDEFFGFTAEEWAALEGAPEAAAARKTAERAAARDCGPDGIFGFTEAEWQALHDEGDEA